jgi:DHA2 family multidrug resistance protein
MGYLVKIVDIRLLVIFGLIVLWCACALFQQLTLQSPPRQFLIALLCLGFGVSLTLAPLTTLSLLNVPQALAGSGSGLITFCRQMGAAFGGSIMHLIIVQRQVFHLAMFGQQGTGENAVYQNLVHALTLKAVHQSGRSLDVATQIAHETLAANVASQATFAAVNDVYFLFGRIALILLVFFSAISIKIYLRQRKAAAPG